MFKKNKIPAFISKHILFVWIVVFFCILTILTVFSYFNYKPMMSLLHKYKLIPVKEQLTEMYINSHLTLPESLEANEIATASFTLHNLEYKDEIYKYVITQSDSETKQIISSGSAKLSHDQYRSFDFSFFISSPEAKTKIEISLPEKDQQIHFWVNNNYGR